MRVVRIEDFLNKENKKELDELERQSIGLVGFTYMT